MPVAVPLGTRVWWGRVLLPPALLGSGFARDAAVLLVGTTVAQGLNVAASPIITRLYEPEHLGVLGLLVSAYSVLTPLACWRYDQAIMLPARHHTAARLLQLSLLITAIMVALSLVLVLLVGRPVAVLLGRPALADWMWAVPALLLLAGVYQTLRTWLGRMQRFGSIAAGRFARGGFGTAAQVGLGWLLGSSVVGLVGGYWLGPALEAVVLAGAACRVPDARPGAPVTLRRLTALARRYRKFPLFAVPGNLSNYLAIEAPTLLLGALYSPADVGLYWLSYRVLALPTALVGDAVSTVFFQRMAALRSRGGSGAALTTQVFVALLGVAVVPMALFFAAAPALFRIVFGPTWLAAADYARALVPAELMLFAAFPLTQAFVVYEKQEVGLLWNLGFVLVSTGTFALGALSGGPLASVQWYSLGSAAMYGVVVVMAFRWSGGVPRSIPAYLVQGLRDRLALGAPV